MRILLLNLYFPPDTSATAKMAEAVVNALREKHDVTVVCGRPSYDPSDRRSWRLWQTEYLTDPPHQNSIRVIRIGSTDYSRAKMGPRIANYLSYVALSIPRALFLKCDLVLGMTDPPFQGIVAAFAAMLKRKPYIYNIRDLYPEMAVAGNIMAAGSVTQVWEALHRWALRRARRVIVLGEDMRARVLSKGLDPRRVVVVRDGSAKSRGSFKDGSSSFSDSDSNIDPLVVREIRGDFRFVILHAGNLGFYGAWQTLIDAMRGLDQDGVGLVFVGEGAQREEIRAAASGLKNVRLLPFFTAEKIPSVAGAPDLHVVTIKSGLEGVIVPSKMYGILDAGKPILAVAPRESDVASLGEKAGFSVWADPDSPTMVARVIRELMGDRQRLDEMGASARRAAPHYDRVDELRKFAETIEEAGAE